jgi:hypothetical protein
MFRMSVKSVYCGLCIAATLASPSFGQPVAAPLTRSPLPCAVSSQLSPLETTLMAAGGALIAVILKDLIFKLLEERRVKRAALEAVYSRYADPLSSSAVSLMWRLHEALGHPGRSRFLKLTGIVFPTNRYGTYDAYKKLSTLYRLAVLLGWVRACKREFLYLKIAEVNALPLVERSIANFESALADGPVVEMERLQELSKLWGLTLPADEERKSSIAVDLGTAIYEFMQKSNHDQIGSLEDEQKSHLVLASAEAITTALGQQEVAGTVISQSCARAIQIIDIREAWIYRDWQSAMGDLVLIQIDSGERRFDVIGFSEFESLCLSGSEEQKRWVARLSAVFDGIDMVKRNPFDHRPNQLLTVLRATAALTKALSACTKNTSISHESLALASKISSDPLSRNSPDSRKTKA